MPSSVWSTLRKRDYSASPGWSLILLRAFLGVTFTYAGLQKLAQRHFFDGSDPTSIQAQLRIYQQHSPIHALLAQAGHHPLISGMAIAGGELAVGVGILLGLWTRVAAMAGMSLSLIFFLSVSFNTRPYYYGSDIVFLFAWTPLALAGSGGFLSLDALMARRKRTHIGAASQAGSPGPGSGWDGSAGSAGNDGHILNRRTLLERGTLTGLTAAGVLLAGGAATAIGRLKPSSDSSAKPLPTLGASSAPPKVTPSSGVATGSGVKGGPALPAPSGVGAGTVLGQASAVPVGGAAGFTDPATGAPAYVVQPSPGQYRAFSAVCTHQGCTVAFSRPDHTFQCPCHGSVFDARTGQVIQGPAQLPLPAIPVVQGAHGTLYVGVAGSQRGHNG